MRAVEDEVRSGMVLGLGTGSTAIHATRRVGELLASGELREVTGVPTAIETADEARRVGIPLLADDVPWEIDVTIDGADEVDPALDLIKGGGGALLREKLVAQASAREVIVVDGSKCVERLGTRHPLPVEVVEFGLATTRRAIAALGAEPVLRAGDGAAPFRTDQGNLILDCRFGPIADAEALAAELTTHAGVVEHGLFLGLADALVIARDAGVEVVSRPGR
ncbi:MAG TPA: ribose-5-phosphate isomerase RpiA [Acidimicrobiia bacterium]